MRSDVKRIPAALAAEGIFPDTAEARSGHLVIGGCDVTELAASHGTPLYVYDEASLRGRARVFREALRRSYPGRSVVCYASKAYAAPWIARLFADEDLGLDVVSGGELRAAAIADVARERIYFHGNNKGEEEIAMALRESVGRIVVDNLDEVSLVSRLAAARGRGQAVLLRVSPGVDPRTHAHLKTGTVDTKFGLGIASGAAEEGVRAILARRALDLRGYHAHIGSQIHEVGPFEDEIAELFAFAAAMRDRHGVALREVSPGGGYAVRYTPDDPPADVPQTIRRIGSLAAAAARRHGFTDPYPELSVEPGRSLVASSAVALYRVGSVKRIPGGRTYVAVDGGMADNIRPTAYGATYTAVLADRLDAEGTADVAIAGKYCETGDILIQHVDLPLPRVGDLIAIPAAGAYHMSMASNYNLALRPAVVVVADGRARLVRRRETYDDLFATEVASRS